MTLAEQKIRDYLQSAPKGTSREQIADIYNQHQGDEVKIGEAINALWSNKEMDEQETGDWQEVKKKWLKKKPEPVEVKTGGNFGGRSRGGAAAGREKDFKRPLNGKQVNSSNKTQGNNRPQPPVNGPKTGAWASKTPLAERMKQTPSKTASGEQSESDAVSPEVSQVKEAVPVVNGSAKAAHIPASTPPQQNNEAKGEEVEAKTPKVNKTATTSWAARLKAGKQAPVVPKPVAKPTAPQPPQEGVSAPVKSSSEQISSAGAVAGSAPPSTSASNPTSSTSNEHSSQEKTQHSKLEEKAVGDEKKETSIPVAPNKDQEVEQRSDSLASTEAISQKESTQGISESKIENSSNTNTISVDEKAARHGKQNKVTRRQTLEEIEDQLLGKNSSSFETSNDKPAQQEAPQVHSNKTENKDAHVQKVVATQEPKQEETVKRDPVPKFTPGYTLPKSLEKHVGEKQPLFSFGFTKSSKNQASETKFTLDNLVRGFNMDLVEAGAIDKLQAKIDSLQQLVRDKEEVIAELKAFKELAQKQAAESQEAAKRKEAAALSELQSSFMPGSESEINMNSNMDIRDMHGMSDLYGGLPPNYFNKGPNMPSSVVSGVNVNPPPGLKRGDGREIHEMRGDKGKQSVEASPKSTEMGYHVHGGMQGGNGHQQGGMHQNMGMYPPGLPYYPSGVPSQYGFNPNFGGFSPRTQMYQHSMSNMPNINMNSQMPYESMPPQHTSNANMPPSFDMHPQSHTPNFMGFDQSMNLNRPSLGGGSSVDGSATGSSQAYPAQGQPSRRGRGEMSQNVGGMERYGYAQQAPGGGYYPMPQPIYPQQPHYQQQQRGMGGGNWNGR